MKTVKIHSNDRNKIEKFLVSFASLVTLAKRLIVRRKSQRNSVENVIRRVSPVEEKLIKREDYIQNKFPFVKNWVASRIRAFVRDFGRVGFHEANQLASGPAKVSLNSESIGGTNYVGGQRSLVRLNLQTLLLARRGLDKKKKKERKNKIKKEEERKEKMEKRANLKRIEV